MFTALARSQLFYYLFLYNFISQLNLQRPKDLSRTAFTQVLHQQNSSSTPWLGVKVSSLSFMFSYMWKGNRVLSNMPEPPGYLELISCGLHSSLERERNIRRRLITSSIKREIRHFHVVVVQRRQRNVQKAWRACKVDGLLYNPVTFFTFSLPSLSSFLKLPTNQGWLRLRRRSVGFGNHDGGSRGWAWGVWGAPPPPIFRPNWGLKGQLHPPYLRVWMTAPAAYLRVWIRNWELQNFSNHFYLFF